MKFLTLALPCLVTASALNGLPDSTTGGSIISNPGSQASVPGQPDDHPINTPGAPHDDDNDNDNDGGDGGNNTAPACDCKGANATTGVNATSYVCTDPRLGPKQLPMKLPLGSFVASYDRLGGLTVEQFLRAWTGPDGRYKYPPQNGFSVDVDGNAINGSLLLEVGTLIDRFGSEYGTYVSAASAPFSQRSLPPSSLDADPSNPDFPYGYHLYKVIRPFTVVAGPIAPWFGQPGLGAQFFTGGTGNIMKLIADGYIEREDPSVLVARGQNSCT